MSPNAGSEGGSVQRTMVVADGMQHGNVRKRPQKYRLTPYASDNYVRRSCHQWVVVVVRPVGTCWASLLGRVHVRKPKKKEMYELNARNQTTYLHLRNYYSSYYYDYHLVNLQRLDFFNCQTWLQDLLAY